MAMDMFLDIKGVKGESRDSKFKEKIDILAWSWGLSNSGSIVSGGGGGGGAGKATFHDLSFVHHIDKASPVLMQACATGVHLKDATITHRKAGKGQQEFLVVKMNDVIITSVTHGGSTDGSYPENVSLAFGKVDLEYRPQNPNGTLGAGVHFKYDIKGNKVG